MGIQNPLKPQSCSMDFKPSKQKWLLPEHPLHESKTCKRNLLPQKDEVPSSY